MAEILGSKLKINSIDIIPSTINHNDEYLKVATDETSYEYVSNQDVKNELNISYEKNAVVNKGYNKTYDLSLTNFSTGLLTSNYSNGFVITTNGSQYDSSWSVLNAFNGIILGEWYSAKADNIYLQIQTPVPMAYTGILRRVIDWYDNVRAFEPLNFVVEASNDGQTFVEMLNQTEVSLAPANVYEYTFNENKVKYLYWRIRYPTAGVTGQRFSYCFLGEVEPNLFTQTEYQKNKLVKLTPFWMQELITYRTTYSNEDGTVSGSDNITEYNANNQMWQAFRGRVDTSNQGWMSANTQAVPCDLIYTPTEIYTSGYYSFSFRKGIWGDTWGYTPINVAILIVDENDAEHVVWHRVMHYINPATFSTEILYIPYNFKQVKWRIISKYSTHVSMGWCQVLKCKNENEFNVGTLRQDYNIFMANKGTNLRAGGYFHNPHIEFNVDENNPLDVTFPDNSKKTFTSLNAIDIKPQKKFRLITPKHLESDTYNSAIFGEISNNTDYVNIVQGTCTGVGSQLDASRYFWRAMCTDVRTADDCWLTTNNGALGGPIYKWNQMKPKGKYVFKFNTGWWKDTNGYSASEVRVHVRNGDSDEWKTVWNVVNIPATYSTYWWSPVIDINFEFNQVYFEMVSRNQSYHGGLACCAVFQECDYDYQIVTGVAEKERYLFERAYQYAYDYQESQNLYLKKDGIVYGLSNNVYRQAEQPAEPVENDIWYDNKQEPLRVYQYKNNEWILFNDVLLGNFNLINGMIQTFHENPYNDNGTYKNSDCIWSTELTLSDEATIFDGDVFSIVNLISNVYHNLNIQDTTKYKAECYLKCVAEDCGYEPGDIGMGTVVMLSDTLFAQPIPYLTKNTIGIWTSNLNTGWRVIHKWSGQIVNANCNNWRLVFKIREL